MPKTPYTVDAGLGEILLELRWKLPPCWLASIVLRVATQTAEGKWSAHLWTWHAITMCQSRCGHWCNSGMTVIGITIWFLLGSEICPSGGSSWLVLWTWPNVHDWGGHRPRWTYCFWFAKRTFSDCLFFYYFKIEDHLLDFKIKIPRQANY